MSQFSVIMQSPEVRDIVQDRTLIRDFGSALLTDTVFRTAATPIEFEGGLGDSRTFSRRGEAKPSAAPIKPGDDLGVIKPSFEQWEVMPLQYGKSVDLHMPTSFLACANLILENAEFLGTHAGRSVSRLSRTGLYRSAISGHTVNSATVNNSVTVPVKHLNGLTRARKTGGTAVRYAEVGATNKLAVKIYDTVSAAFVDRNIVGYTPDVAGDEVGPGSITLDVAVTIDAVNYAVVAYDATYIVRSGIGSGLVFAADPKGPHAILSSNIFTLADIRAMVRRLQQTGVKPFRDGYYRGYLDATSHTQLFADDEAKNLWKEPGQQVQYRDLALGTLLGVVWFRAEECPQVGNVNTTWSEEALPLELTTAGGVGIHRPIIVGRNALDEHYIDQSKMISNVGLIAQKGSFNLDKDGITINVERISMITRSPLDRAQQMPAMSWLFQGDFVVGTDGVDEDSGGPVGRFKRMVMCEHGE